MEKNILKHKNQLDKEIKNLAKEIEKLNVDWSKTSAKFLAEFAVRGKGIRGSLVLMVFELFNKKLTPQAIKIAATIEYLHSALLIQDDIMDHDEIRRGKETIHVKYEKIGRKLKVDDPKDFGKSMAICLADIAIFYSLKNLAKADKNNCALMEIVSKEFSLVGFGQIQDLVFAHSKRNPSIKQIIEMYTYKTARYTFSVPMMIGAILANKNAATINKLEKIGINMGLIYQMTDDMLTLSGKSQEVGKTIGNDIVENKKTLYHILLKNKANKGDLKVINSIFGKKDIKEKDIKKIKELISYYKIDKDIEKRINVYKNQAIKLIKELNIDKKSKNEFFLLLEYLLTREK